MTRLARALDHIAAIAVEPTVDQMLARLRRIVGDFGFESFLLTGVPDPGRRIDGFILLSGWDESWLERYVAHDYVQIDPIARRLHHAGAPFLWSEVVPGQDLDADARRVMDEAASIGMHDGLCVPLVDAVGRRSVLSLAARSIDLSPLDRGVLHLLAVYSQTRIRDLLGEPLRPLERSLLSPRERECLQWTAVGKTSWEISTILDLSRATVDEYVASAMRKLGAVNRTQAVAEAIRCGLIH